MPAEIHIYSHARYQSIETLTATPILLTIDCAGLQPPPSEICYVHSGLEAIVSDTFFSYPINEERYRTAMADIAAILKRPRGREELIIGVSVFCKIGCHRSVAMAERLTKGCQRQFRGVWVETVKHFNLEKGLRGIRKHLEAVAAKRGSERERQRMGPQDMVGQQGKVGKQGMVDQYGMLGPHRGMSPQPMNQYPMSHYPMNQYPNNFPGSQRSYAPPQWNGPAERISYPPPMEDAHWPRDWQENMENAEYQMEYHHMHVRPQRGEREPKRQGRLSWWLNYVTS
ncbi:hypothetical protein MMC14_007382 [Varicellaria rhodocarpa]|nr:hypothetical protein [Varicellaria rhodocarpa]